jgi:hypothetical protein
MIGPGLVDPDEYTNYQLIIANRDWVFRFFPHAWILNPEMNENGCVRWLIV